MSYGFSAFSVLFAIAFLGILAAVLGVFISALVRKGKNDRSPRLTVWARVVSRRTDISHSHNHQGASYGGAYHTYSTYCATFEVESGDRLELQLPGEEYGLLAEGDEGQLTFQGTRFLSFARKSNYA